MAKNTDRRKLNTGERYDEKKNIYVYRIMRNGKRLSCTAKTLDELRLKENKLKVDIDNGIGLESNRNITLNEYFDIWCKVALTGKRKPSTVQNYVSYFNTYIRECVGKKRIADIKKSHLLSVFDDMRKSGKKHSTFANLKSCLCLVFESACDEDIISKNPARNIEIIDTESKQRTEVSETQMSLFLEYVKNNMRFKHDYAFFLLLFNSGCRIGELSALTIDDLDFENNMITVTKSVNRYRKADYGFTVGIGTTKSKTSTRTVKIDSEVMREVRKHVMQYPPNNRTLPCINDNGVVDGEIGGFVFQNQQGNTWVEPSVLRLIKRIVDDYNKSNANAESMEYFTPHQCRHSYASLAYRSGMDAKETSSQLGHKDITTTLNIYTHLEKEEDRKQALVKVM